MQIRKVEFHDECLYKFAQDWYRERNQPLILYGKDIVPLYIGYYIPSSYLRIKSNTNSDIPEFLFKSYIPQKFRLGMGCPIIDKTSYFSWNLIEWNVLDKELSAPDEVWDLIDSRLLKIYNPTSILFADFIYALHHCYILSFKFEKETEDIMALITPALWPKSPNQRDFYMLMKFLCLSDKSVPTLNKTFYVNIPWDSSNYSSICEYQLPVYIAQAVKDVDKFFSYIPFPHIQRRVELLKNIQLNWESMSVENKLDNWKEVRNLGLQLRDLRPLLGDPIKVAQDLLDILL